MVHDHDVAETTKSTDALQVSKPWVARFLMARAARTITTMEILSTLKLELSELRTRATDTMNGPDLIVFYLSSDELKRLPNNSTMEDNIRSKRRAKNPINLRPKGLDLAILNSSEKSCVMIVDLRIRGPSQIPSPWHKIPHAQV